MTEYKLKHLCRQSNCVMDVHTPTMKMIIEEIIKPLANAYIGFRGISHVYDRHSHMGSYILLFQGKPEHLAKVMLDELRWAIMEHNKLMYPCYHEQEGNLFYYINYSD